ncbi:hypothetical protein MOQ72_18395 [Saccharopolyspora sp. K220]|uniref:hypothetical protein n=1 Tax=Saccharopolyspora soli TaxID=2926618 RepID=UPI001F5645C8|nr:hypothetical protein [Saccharopolyspora soli]MCI2419415.1 hypothetical protein [Saccharopolyspora soli]
MHSGRTLGWSGQLDWPPSPAPPAHGRHRRTGSAATWTPTPRPRASAPPAPAGGLAADPLVDTMPVGGLHKFDLGMVPASVTPPRTWRQAAWFAIASSAAALGGLVLVTAFLADNSTRIEGLELPSMPRGGDYPPLPQPDPYYLTGDPTRPEAVQVTGSVQLLPPLTVPDIANRPSAIHGPAPRGPGSATASGTPTSPASTTEAPYALALTDTEAIKRRGDEYYAAIARGDLRSAYSLTTGPLRAEGYESFAARYSDAASVEVVDVYVTPFSTVHTLRLTGADGAVRTERRELQYEMGRDPLITSDERIS